jgi:hypothetical protein
VATSTFPVSVALVLAAAPPVVAVVAIVLAGLRERTRPKHEREMRLRDERLRAYLTLARTTRGVDPTQPYDMADVAEALSEVELLTESPEVLEAATTLHGATALARRVVRKRYTAGDPRPERTDFVRNFIRRAAAARNAFIGAARTELGLPPSPPPPPAQAKVSAREAEGSLSAQQIEDP